MYKRNYTVMLFVFICSLVYLSNSFAQIQIIRTFPQASVNFIGGRNMDNDNNEELVYYTTGQEKLSIIDGNTGVVEWESTNNFYRVDVAGYHREDNGHNGNTGYSPFCDINGDGIFEISIYAQETMGGDFKAYIIGLAGSSGAQDSYVIPKNPSLSQNYPNPFNPTTTIEYEIQQSGNVEIKIFDEIGQLIRTLVNEGKDLGSYSVLWDGKSDGGSNVSTGVYFYQLKVNDFLSNKKMILLK